MFLALSAFMLVSASANHQIDPNILELQDAVAIFHQRGFDLLMAEASVLSSEADLQSNRAITNPMLSASIGHTGGAYSPSQCGSQGCSATAYSIGVNDQAAIFTFLTGKRSLRIDIARFALRSTRLQRDDAIRTLTMLLKGQFLAIAIDEANLHFLQDVHESYENTYALFESRYKAGDISETDLARMETAYLETEQNVDSAIGQVQIDHTNLLFMLGQKDDAKPYNVKADWLEQVNKSRILDVDVDDWIEIAKTRRPDLKALDLQRQQAFANLRLAKRNRFPDITLSFNYQEQGNSETAIQPPTYTGGLSIVPPLLYQYQGEVKKAQAEWHTQQIAYQKLESQITADVRQAYASITISKNRLDRMQNKLKHRAARSLELVQLQYQKGAASLLDLLDAQRTFIAINQEYILDLSAFWQACFQLESATAMEIQP